MNSDWLLHISYAIHIGFAVLMCIQLVKIQWAGHHYMSTHCGMKVRSEAKDVIFRSGIKILFLIVFITVNKVVQITLAGSKEALNEWKVTHAEALLDTVLVMFIFVFVFYAIKAFNHHMKSVTEKDMPPTVSFSDNNLNAVEETAEEEVEKVLALIQERYN